MGLVWRRQCDAYCLNPDPDCEDSVNPSGVCSNTCEYANDGICDDGALGSFYDVCDYGTDCADCGVR